MKVVQPWKHGYGIIPASQMICQQAFTVSSKTANHLANTYALEYNYCKQNQREALFSRKCLPPPLCITTLYLSLSK